jgi:PTH1 family peptidyl-tRNA hydrolase
MGLIVGLGNPGEAYKSTRHNTGFLFLDYFLSKVNKGHVNWKMDKIFNCELCKTADITGIKPQSFMNNSGGVVQKYMLKNSISSNELVVVYDDLDIKFGTYKIVKNKSPKQHNGVNDIIKAIGTEAFLHVRIGVDNRVLGQRSIKGLDYVLMHYSKEELLQLNQTFEDVSRELLPLLQ